MHLLLFVLAILLTYENFLFAQSGITARQLRQQCVQACSNVQSYYPEASDLEMANLEYQCISRCQNDSSFRESLSRQVSIHDYPDDNSSDNSSGDPKMQNYVDSCKNITSMDAVQCLLAYKQGTPLKSLLQPNNEDKISQEDGPEVESRAGGGTADSECTDPRSGSKGKFNTNGECIVTPSATEPPPGASQEALAQQAVQACQSAEAQVRSSCDSESKSWLQEINNVMGGVMPAIQAQQNTKAMMENKKSACGKLVAAESGVKGALATFQIMCANASNNCNKQCDPALVSLPYYRSQLETSKKACNDKAISAKESYARAAQASQEIMVAVQSCRAMMEIEVTDLPECSKPENINNPGCAVNLGTPIQVSAAAIQPSTGSGALNHQGALDKTATDMGSDKGFGLDPDDENREVTPHKSNPGEEIGGSKGGGNVASSSGTGGGGASGRDGGGQPKGLISNILSGFFGGGGGGTGGGGRSGGWRALFGGGSGSQPTAQAQNKMPDLRQFMPGGAHDPNRHRGIAGQFIGKDGMSGPHSNIWKMINNRYQYKRATLLP